MVNIFIHIIILISLIFAGCASTPPTQTFTLPTNSLAERISAVESHIPVKERFKWNEKTITDRMEHYNVPGVSIAVVNNHKIEWAKGYGTLEIGSNKSVTPEPSFKQHLLVNR